VDLIENIDIGGRRWSGQPPKISKARGGDRPGRLCRRRLRNRSTGRGEPRDAAGVGAQGIRLTARYDGNIATELERLSAANGSTELSQRPVLPARLHFAFTRRQELRYGEIPHQRAALYVPVGSSVSGLARRGNCRARSFPTTI